MDTVAIVVDRVVAAAHVAHADRILAWHAPLANHGDEPVRVPPEQLDVMHLQEVAIRVGVVGEDEPRHCQANPAVARARVAEHDGPLVRESLHTLELALRPLVLLPVPVVAVPVDLLDLTVRQVVRLVAAGAVLLDVGALALHMAFEVLDASGLVLVDLRELEVPLCLETAKLKP